MISKILIDEVQNIKSQGSILNLSDNAVFNSMLVFCHQMMVATPELLREAVERWDGIDQHRDVVSYFAQHIDEELNHDVWLAEDLLSVGVDVKSIAPFPLAALVTGMQYYHIKHTSPNYLLGYMSVLEGFPPTLEEVGRYEKIHGKELLRTVRIHAEEDIKHRVDLFEIIDKVNSPEILTSAILTADLMNQAWTTIRTATRKHYGR